MEHPEMSHPWVKYLKPRFFRTQRRSHRRVAAGVEFRPRVEHLEDRLAPATVTWVGGASGNWGLASNWSAAALPGGGDDVVISGTVTVTHGAGSDTVNSISLGAGAALQVTGNSFISANSFSNAGSVLVGAGSTLVAAYTQTGGTTTLQGGSLATFSPPPGNSFALNGFNDFAQVPSTPSLESAALNSQVTLEAWVYLNQLPSAAGHIMQLMAKSQFGNDLDLQVEGDNRIHFYAGNTFPNNIVSNTVLQAGRWYHVAVTFQAGAPGQLQIFVNGVLDATTVTNLTRFANSNPLTIGENAVFTDRFFNGLITDVSVWNTVQTPAQIQSEMTANLTGTEAGLVAAYNFSEGSGTTIHDRTANHNDGILTHPDWTVSPVSSVSLLGGSLSGTGTVSGNVVNSGGSVVPGAGATGGRLTVVGGYTQGSGGALNIQVGGSSASGTFGSLAVSGLASLAGTLNVTTVNSYVPIFSDSYTALTFGSRSGDFATSNLPALGGEPLLSAAFSPTSLILTGGLSATTTALASSANASVYGQTVTLTATVTAASGSTPAGTVDFLDQTTGHDLGTFPLQLVGRVDQASVVVSGLIAGSHTIVATYTSNHPGSFQNSVSPGFSQVVNKATLTVTASNASKVFGQANPTFTSTLTGFVNGDNSGVVSGSPSLTTSATTTSPAGTYTITAALGTLSAANYGFTFVNGTLTVNADATTTTVAAASQGLRVTLTATVGANAPGSGTPTGTVDFVDTTTGTDLGSVTLSGGRATLVATVLGTSQVITASYGGDTNFLQSSGPVTVSTSNSIYVLNPSASGALSVVSNAILDMPGTVVVDSNSPTAVTASDNAQVTASSINVVGGVLTSGSAAFHPAPVTGAAFVPDPLGGLGAPAGSGSPRGSVILTGSSSLTIGPGIYSGISVANGAHLTLLPGIYVINGGGFQVADMSSVSGSGVVICNAGGSIRVANGAVVNLSPPTTGPYAGIVFFQPASDNNRIAVTDNAVVQLNGGVFYAPAAVLNLANNAVVLQGSLIVNQLHVFDNAIADDPPSGGSPLVGPKRGHRSEWAERLAAGYAAAVDALLAGDWGGRRPRRWVATVSERLGAANSLASHAMHWLSLSGQSPSSP
jgi:hypothetical protein